VNRSITRVLIRSLVCAAVLALITATDRALSVNPTTAALTFLIAVLFISAYWGLFLAVAMSAACTLAFNYFFLYPTGTFTIAETQNWIALGAFLVTALLAGNLAERARRESAKAISAEAARQSERLRAALLDSVAHEFRTPLTGIKAAVTTMLSDSDAPAAALDSSGRRELLTVIDEETDRLDRLVSAASQMAQLESSAVVLHPENVAVHDIIQDAVEAARAQLLNHELLIDLPERVPRVRVDREQTTRALRHLLENAGKYSPAGTAVRIRAEAAGSQVRIAVSDAGPGIEPKEQSLVFNKFFRGAGHRHRTPGSGMGLAIAKALVEAQAGQIGVSSSPSGTTFFIVLPAFAAS
jgi:K+-sensing histidine kinase KdpD